MVERDPKFLPLNDAARIATENGIGDEYDAIRGIPLHGIPESMRPRVEKGHIVQLLREHHLFDDFIARVWPFATSLEGRELLALYERYRLRHIAAGQGKTGEIEQLLAELAASNGDRPAGKRIRARLRQLGHYGGLRSGVEDLASFVPSSNLEQSLQESTPDPMPLTIPPPIDGAEMIIARIHSLVGLPERNHEGLVKDFLVRSLGFQEMDVVFQQGRVDVCVFNENRQVVAVFEVKRTIAGPKKHDSALRQGWDYARRTGAKIVVVTDGDRYVIYDRRKSDDYDPALCGRFQLTAFREDDSKLLDLLRPASLRNMRQ